MSIVIIAFPNAPKVSPEALQREKKLDETLEKKVHGTFLLNVPRFVHCFKPKIFLYHFVFVVVVLEILNREEAPSKQIISYVMHMLSQEEEMDGLPPGGGLVAK